MTNRPRCPECNHIRNRIVSMTSKRKGSIPAEPRQHKKHCDCHCHRRLAAECGLLVKVVGDAT